MIPNLVLDELLRTISGSELKILSIVYRKTVGYGKKEDEISYSQFIDKTGLSKSTISRSIESLESKELIKVDRSKGTNKYTYCLPGISTRSGSKIEQEDVQKSNTQPVRKSDTQKKLPKENLKETTTSSSSDLSDDFFEVVEFWNKTFKDTLKNPDKKLIKGIQQSIATFGVDQLKTAMINRYGAKYYRKHKPELLDKPQFFFCFPSTIENDLKRKPEGIYTYEEKNERIFNRLNTDEDFEILREFKDHKGQPKWKLKTFNLL